MDPYYAAGYPQGHPGAVDPYQNYDPYPKQYASRSRDPEFAASTGQNPPARFAEYSTASMHLLFVFSLTEIMILMQLIVQIRTDPQMVKCHLDMMFHWLIRRSRQDILLHRISSDNHRLMGVQLLHLTSLRSLNTTVLNSEPKISFSGQRTKYILVSGSLYVHVLVYRSSLSVRFSSRLM